MTSLGGLFSAPVDLLLLRLVLRDAIFMIKILFCGRVRLEVRRDERVSGSKFKITGS